MKQYIINENELKYLLKESQLLNALQSGGVDNWQGYDESIYQYETDQHVKIDYIDDVLSRYAIYKEKSIITLDDAEEMYNELDNISKT